MQKNTRLRNRRIGFTLLEMSIVLIIIGLITGVVVVSKSLIRAGQLRDAVAEYDMYLKAIKEFQDKYQALPGDMNNATSFWTADSSCPAGSGTLTAVTCNGDGNGTIGTSDTSGNLTNTTEWFHAWQQLVLAGFIPGVYTGIAGNGTYGTSTGNDVPASKLGGAGWTLNYFLMTSDGSLWGDQYGHVLNFGVDVAGTYTIGPVLTASEALNIDNKLDDGWPGTGKIRAWRASVLSHCTSDTTQTGSTYNTAANGNACSLVFLLGF